MEPEVYRQFESLERDHWWFRGRRRVYGGMLASLLGQQRPRRTLDLGCGMGGFQEILRQLSDEVFACDVDCASLRVCRRRGFNETVAAASHRLPFADASFDLVCLFDVLEHSADDRAVLWEINRLLKPGGMVFLSVPAYQFLYANNDRVAGHYRRYNRRQLLQLFNRSGLVSRRASYSNVLLLPLIASAVLGAKLLEFLFGNRQSMQHSNLSWPTPRWLNAVLYRVFAAELLLSRHRDWPFGHSLVAAAHKPVVESANE